MFNRLLARAFLAPVVALVALAPMAASVPTHDQVGVKIYRAKFVTKNSFLAYAGSHVEVGVQSGIINGTVLLVAAPLSDAGDILSDQAVLLTQQIDHGFGLLLPIPIPEEAAGRKFVLQAFVIYGRAIIASDLVHVRVERPTADGEESL